MIPVTNNATYGAAAFFARFVRFGLTWHDFWCVIKVMSSDPVILGIILSDSVIREWGTGKLSLIGCFNAYNVPGFPFQVPPFVTTIILTNFKGKLTKPKNVTARIEDPTNSIVLANISGQINAPPEYDFTGAEVLEMAFPMMPFPIYHAGPYSVDVLIDGEKVGSRNIMVVSTTAQSLPPQKI